MIKIENKLYSSTEVAEILGVSLRSVYRYLEEGKLMAEVKTATGRHRFTRQNIVDFLYPGGEPTGDISVEPKIQVAQEIKVTPVVPEVQPTVQVPVETVPAPAPQPQPVPVSAPASVEPSMEVETQKIEVQKESEEEQVDWLAKFREAAKKFEQNTEEVTGFAPVEESPFEELSPKSEMIYYRSRLGGLKDIAQNIDKTSRSSGLDYAFTLNAGLSLYKPINPFSVLHVYVRPKDKDFFERILALTPSDEANAQLCIITSDENAIYSKTDEMHGLKVVAKSQLMQDISEYKEELLKEAQSILI